MTARSTLTTAEVALLLGINASSVARWARDRGIQPLRRIRCGRSTVTVWRFDDLADATAPIGVAS